MVGDRDDHGNKPQFCDFCISLKQWHCFSTAKNIVKLKPAFSGTIIREKIVMISGADRLIGIAGLLMIPTDEVI